MYYFETGKHQYNTDCLDDIVKKIRRAKYPNWELARQDVGAVYRAECLLYYSKGVANLAYQTRLKTITPLTKLYNNYAPIVGRVWMADISYLAGGQEKYIRGINETEKQFYKNVGNLLKRLRQSRQIIEVVRLLDEEDYSMDSSYRGDLAYMIQRDYQRKEERVGTGYLLTAWREVGAEVIQLMDAVSGS